MFVGLPGLEPGMRVYETPSITFYLQAHPFIQQSYKTRQFYKNVPNKYEYLLEDVYYF